MGPPGGESVFHHSGPVRSLSCGTDPRNGSGENGVLDAVGEVSIQDNAVWIVGGTSMPQPVHGECTGGHSSCVAYMDDILIATADWDSHMRVLSMVLEKLREAGVKLNGSKC